MYRPALILLFWVAACAGDDAVGSGADAGPCIEQTGCWRGLADIDSGEVQEVSVVAVRGKIYVLGGFNSTAEVLPDVQVYDPGANSWSQVAPLPQAMHHINAAVVNDRIYVVGALLGIDFAASARTWEYDPDADQWTEKAPMPLGTERGAAAVGVVDGTIYVAGGVRGRAVDEVSSYDPALDQWDTSLPPLSSPSDHLTGAVVGGIFYAIGGRNGDFTSVLDRVEAFDPMTRVWTARTPMPTARGGCAAGVVDGSIIVVGGEGNSERVDRVFPQVETYDPASDQWSSLTPMLTPRHGMGAVGLDGKLWVPGGATRHFFAASAIAEVFELPAQ